MSLNWREIEAIVAELPLEGSLIQRVHQIGFHALVFELHHPKERFWELYVEVGTPSSRLHRLSGRAKEARKHKTEKLQRFIQYMRAHIEGLRIKRVEQINQDRLLIVHLEKFLLIFRFYSGPGANIIVTDPDFTILELLFRRPQRKEVRGETLLIEKREKTDEKKYPIREYPPDFTFNQFIEHYYTTLKEREDKEFESTLHLYYQKEISKVEQQLKNAQKRKEHNEDFENLRLTGDLLQAHRHHIDEQSEWVSLPSFEEEGVHLTISLDPTKDIQQNIELYWRRYHKAKKGYELAVKELESLTALLDTLRTQYERDLEIANSDDEKRKKALFTTISKHLSTKSDSSEVSVGVRFTSGPFTLLVGRNAKENDLLLRRQTRGNDWWVHLRDSPGAYVFIKAISQKSVPLETLLDAANLALLYSKVKEGEKVDLYYTQVKYLRRPKKGKKGVVLPTQEKNLTVTLDQKRVDRLFLTKEGG